MLKTVQVDERNKIAKQMKSQNMLLDQKTQYNKDDKLPQTDMQV